MYNQILDNKIYGSNTGGSKTSGKGNSVWFTVFIIICVLVLFGLVLWLIFKPSLIKNPDSLENPTFNDLYVTGSSFLYGDVIMGSEKSNKYNSQNLKGTNSLTVNYDARMKAPVTAESVYLNDLLNVKGNATFEQDVTIVGTLNAGNINQNGNFDIKGNLGVSGTIGVTGAATFYNNANVAGTLGVTGAANFYNNVTIVGTLNAGNINQNGNFDIKGNLGVSGTIGVTGAATFYNNANVAGALGVTGAATLYGNTNVAGNLGVTGAATFYNNAIVGGTLGVTGASTLYGNTNVGGTLGVTGAATFYNNVTVVGTLNAGNINQNGDFDIKGNLGVSGTIGVTGAAIFYNNANVAGTFGVTGASTLYGNTNVAGALGVTGAATFYNNANVGGTLGVTGAAIIYGNTYVKGNLGVTGAATLYGNTNIAGTLGVTGASTLYGNTNVAGTLGVTGAATFYNNANIAGDLGVTGAANLFSANILASLGVTGISSFYSDAKFLENTIIDNGSVQYTTSVPGGSNELTNNFKIESGSATIMNAKSNGNQVHLMNGSSTPFLLIGNGNGSLGVTGARVYDEYFNPPPGLGPTPTFSTVNVTGTGTFGNINTSGNVVVSGTGTFGNINTSGNINAKGSLAFGVTGAINNTYYTYDFSASTLPFSGLPFPYGTNAIGWAGTNGTNTSQIATADRWKCPKSGLWYVKAQLLSGDGVSGKFCTVGNLTTSTPYAISNEYDLGPSAGVYTKVMNVNLLTPINKDDEIIIASLTGVGSPTNTAFFETYIIGLTNVTSYITFQLVTEFNNPNT